SDKTKKHDEKTKREAKGKSLVKLSTGFRNLSEEFENFSSHSTNEVNAASAPVTIVEPNSTNSTNSFNVVGPSNNVVRKFNGKADEGFLVGYSVNIKAFRVFNSRTRIVQETLHINFLENQPNVAGSGPTWLFDIDTLTQSMNYQQVVAGNQPNSSVDPQNTDADATFEVKELESEVYVSPSSSDKTKKHDEKTKREAKGKSLVKLSTGFRNLSEEFENFSSHSTNEVNAASAPVTIVEPNSTNSTNSFNVVGPSNNVVSSTLEIYDEEAVGTEAGFSNLETSIPVSPIPTTRVHKDHPVIQIIGDLSSAPQTRKEPKRLHQALKDPSWIEAMLEELL
nr:ribonuclease H-like domain-containing protein [Tanacetum cinerariifolium]